MRKPKLDLRILATRCIDDTTKKIYFQDKKFYENLPFIICIRYLCVPTPSLKKPPQSVQ